MNRTPASGCAYLVVAFIPMKDQKVASKPFLCPVEQPSCTISPYRSICGCAATFSQADPRRSLLSLSYGTNSWERSFGKRASRVDVHGELVVGHLEEPRSGGDEGMYDLHKHLLSSGHTLLPLGRRLRSSILSSGRLVRPYDSCARHPFEVLQGTL